MQTTWNVEVEQLPSTDHPWPARTSVPLPAGSELPAGFVVRGPDEREVLAQHRVLVPRADGCPRWVQLDFPCSGVGTHTVVPLASEPLPPPADAPDVPAPLDVTGSGPTFAVRSGRLTVEIDARRARPLTAIRWRNRDLVTPDQAWTFTVTSAQEDFLPLVPDARRAVAVEARGPYRFQASWEARHALGADLAVDVRFRLEFLAGLEGFSLGYQFFHRQPERERLDLKAIDATFSLPGLAAGSGRAVVVQRAYSHLSLRRSVRSTTPVRVLLDRTRLGPYVEDLAMLADDSDYPYFIAGHDSTGEVVALENDDAAVTCAMRNLVNQRPKTITVRPGCVAFGIWPERAGLLSLPQGRSCRQEFCFLFADPDPRATDARLARPAAVYLEPAPAWLAAPDSRHAGPTWVQPRLLSGHEKGAALFDAVLRSGTQALSTVAEMFHHGDTPNPGYQMSYAGVGHAPRTPGALPEYTFAAGSRIAHPLFHTSDHLPPVWVNNEYDGIYCLALETLRTRDMRVLRKLQAAARHQIEVDFVHYSDHWQHHRATPAHTYDHVARSAAIPSHQWTQGLYYYYVLTGDDDVPEVVRGICDYNLVHLSRPELQDIHYFNRELGWATIALVFGSEATGDPCYIDAARNLIRELEAYATREEFDATLDRSATLAAENIKTLGRQFTTNTIPMGVTFFHQATGEPWARDLLLRWVRYGMTNYNDRRTGQKLMELFPECFTYVYELTGDRRLLESTLWHLVSFMQGRGAGCWDPPARAQMDSKMYARVYRGLVHYLSACARCGLLAEAERRVLSTS